MKLFRQWRKALIPASILIVAFSAAEHSVVMQKLLRDWALGAGLLAPLVFAGIFALATVALVPASLLLVVGGVLFGPVWGTVYNLTGATLGAMLAFLLSRYMVSDWVRTRIGGRMENLFTRVEREGWRIVALSRLIPIIPFCVLNYGFGLTRVRFFHYSLATLICLIPSIFLYTYIGYTGRQAVEGKAAATHTVLAIMVLLAVAVFASRYIRRRPVSLTPDGG